MNRLAEILSIATGRPGYAYINGLWRRSLRGMGMTPSVLEWSLRAACALMHARHEELERMQGKNPVIAYYRGWSLHLRGEFALAAEILKEFLQEFPKHYEAELLLVDCCSSMKDKEHAFALLEKRLSRKKTWIKYSGLIDTKDEFGRMKADFDESLRTGLTKKSDPVVLEHVAMGAQRCGLYEVATGIWEDMARSGRIPQPKPKDRLHPGHAHEALEALQRACDRYGLDLFLISGTLLGLVRGGTFITGDTDLDTGLFSGFSPAALRKAVYDAGCFSIMPQRSPHYLRIRHANGTAIDIFTHYQDRGDYWHRGVKVSWHNSPFALKKATFQGIRVAIPDPPEKYLEENYGHCWHEPITRHFDSTFDCPNSKVENEDELYIHKLRTHRIQVMEDPNGCAHRTRQRPLFRLQEKTSESPFRLQE